METLFQHTQDVVIPPPPTVVLTTAVPTPTSTAPIPVTVTFSSPVVGFDPDALTLVNATVANFTGSGSTYTFELVPSVPGPVTVSVAEGVAMLDAFPGIVNEASDPLSMTYDSSAPASPSIAIASGVPTVYSQTIPVQLAATETTSTPMQMCVVESSGSGTNCSGCVYETFAATKSITFATAVTETKTVSAKFKDAAGNETSCVSDDVQFQPMALQPRYAIAPNWNDYAKAADPSQACAGTENGYSACIHGGEHKFVALSDASCTGINVVDALGAFDWTCQVVSGNATFYGQLKSTKSLKDLVDASAWKNNSISITGGIHDGQSTVSTAWWANPVAPLPDNSSSAPAPDRVVKSLASAGTIYTLSSTRDTWGYDINASKIGIVFLNGATTTRAAGATTNYYVSTATSTKFLWIEIQTTGTSGNNFMLSLSSVFTRVENFVSENIAGTYGIMHWGGKTNNLIHNATINANSAAVYLNGTYITVDKAVLRAASTAVFGSGCFVSNSSGSSNHVLNDITCTDSQSVIWLRPSVSNNTLSNITAIGMTGNSSFAAIHVDAGSNNNSFSDINISRSAYRSIQLDGTGNRFTNVRITDSSGPAIHVNPTAAANNYLKNVTVYRGSASQAIFTSGSNAFNIFENLVLVGGTATIRGNCVGCTFFNGATLTNATTHTLSNFHNVLNANFPTYGILTTANNTTISQAAFAHSNDSGTGYAISAGSASANNKLTGNILVGDALTKECFENSSGANPGILDGVCANQGASNATFVHGLSLANSFVGKIAAPGDATNTSDTDGLAAYSVSMDAFGFANFFRFWGLDGSAFPSDDHKGVCTSATVGNCRIWDTSLKNIAGNAIYNNSGTGSSLNSSVDGSNAYLFPLAGGDCPSEVSGDKFLSTSSAVFAAQPGVFLANAIVTNDVAPVTGICGIGDTCYQRYLKNAIEIVNDGIGDDDGLCEASEACLYAPNFGAYQGHGTLTQCTYNANGGISGVTMSGYTVNGSL